MRRQSCQQDGAEQQRERAAPPGHVCASAHGGVSGAQSRFAGADCPAGQPCRPADRRARCPADRRAPCRARCRVESVHVSPPSLAAVYALRRFFMRAGGLPCGGRAFCIPGLNPGGTYSPNKKGTRRGGLPCLPPACPAFSLLCCPHPPQPALAERSSPPGKGETKSLFRRGLRPRHPGIRPPAALVRPAAVVLNGGACPCAALAIPAPGERTISNAEVPLPRSPLSLAAGTAHRERSSVGVAANREFLPPGTTRREPLPVGFAANHGFSPGDARGEAPCIRKL